MAGETQAQESSQQTGNKTKKINKLTLAEIQKKIGDFESARQTKSVYYKHLLQRKRELESRAR